MELYCPTCERSYAGGERCPADDTRLVRIASSSADQLIGRDLDRRYTIVEKIGHGGMGTVYRGTQHSVGREVAIKVVTPSLVAEPVVIKRFLREAKLASRLAHPNAVSVLDFGQTDDGMFYLVMELVSGVTLDRLLETERTISAARLVRIGAQICDALEGAHALDIVHRDLKPSNVMVMSTGRDLIKVLDFGLAKSLTQPVSLTTMTNAGALLGTPVFMPPEAVTGQNVDARADLYSLGCLLHLLASGTAPFRSQSVHELIAMHASDPPPPIPGLPVRIAAVILRLLEKDPARRFQTAKATREALESALSRQGTNDMSEPDSTLVTASTVLGWVDPVKGGRDTGLLQALLVSGRPLTSNAAPSVASPRVNAPVLPAPGRAPAPAHAIIAPGHEKDTEEVPRIETTDLLEGSTTVLMSSDELAAQLPRAKPGRAGSSGPITAQVAAANPVLAQAAPPGSVAVSRPPRARRPFAVASRQELHRRTARDLPWQRPGRATRMMLVVAVVVALIGAIIAFKLVGSKHEREPAHVPSFVVPTTQSAE